LKNDENSWKIAYMKDKDNIEMIQKQFLFKFNNINKNDDEWNNSELKNIYMLTCMKQMDGNIVTKKEGY
jgi:hypothetical protein